MKLWGPSGASGIWPPLARILVVGLGFAAGFVLVYLVTVRTVRGRLFGDASLRGALLTRSAMANGVDSILNAVSVASLLAAVAVVATVALVRLERVRGLAAIGLLVGANLSTLLLKSYLLDRPDLGLREVSPATLNSLPSGHATAVFSAFAALLFVVPTAWRYPTSLIGLVTAITTALATMSAGWHRAGDSMAAFLLVGVWTVIAAVPVLIADTSSSDDRTIFRMASVGALVGSGLRGFVHARDRVGCCPRRGGSDRRRHPRFVGRLRGGCTADHRNRDSGGPRHALGTEGRRPVRVTHP